MHTRRTRSAFILALIGILFTSTVIAPSASAQSSSGDNPYSTCVNTENSGLLSPIPDDTYAIYVQLGKIGQRAAITLTASDSNGNGCTTIGSVAATGNAWTRVGSWLMTTDPDMGAYFTLDSDQLDPITDANRPSIMLISETNPICVPNPTCQVALDGYSGTVLPLSNSIASNMLRVTRVVAPESDSVVRVTQYVDERPVYNTKQLETFDWRYITHGSQRAVSVVEYASGQRISITQTIPESHADTFFNFLFRIYQKNPNLLFGIFICVLIWVISLIAIAIIQALQYRYYWRLAHGLIKQKASRRPSPRLSEIEYLRRKRIKRFIGTSARVSCLLLIILIVSVGFNHLVASFYTVRGASMEQTYRDGNEVVVNRVPVTLAHLSGRNYVPKRGEVVILEATYGPQQPQNYEGRENNEFIIKRVLGLPGERIVITNGIVTIHTTNGEILKPDTNSQWAKRVQAGESVENIDLTLTEDELFVSGDNRSESVDSRFNGAIRTNELVGIVTWKLW